MIHHTNPKFDIGQTVRHIASDADNSLFVVSVITETCPGGTQHTYACRGIRRGITTMEIVRYNEVELRLATPEELEAEAQSSLLKWVGRRKEQAIDSTDFELAQSWNVVAELIADLVSKGDA
jgi:hypothetical protein